jgi:hypothetical protein
MRSITLAVAVAAATVGCGGTNAAPGIPATGVVIEQSGMSPPQDQLVKAMTSGLPWPMTAGGLAGAQGGGHFKILEPGTHEVLLPLPQLTDAQIPLCYAITSAPPGDPLGNAVKQVVLVVYKPLALACHHTFLHKPIGLY